MGCGVSKEDIAEPSRIQSVPVRDGSPTKCLDAADQNVVNTTPVTQETTTACTSPASTATTLPPPPPAPVAVAAVADVAAPAASPDHCVANGTPVLPFPFPTSNGDSCTCTKPPEEKASGVATARISNGLVGTLASLEEILNAQETAIKSKLKVTAEKIASYGGVLRSLENTVELQEAQAHQNADPEPEEQEAGSARSVLSPAGSHGDDPVSPSNLPALEVSRKKLPPLATPSSFMIDKGTDPFVKTPLPTQLLKSLSAQNTHDIPVSSIDLTTHLSAPSSAQSPSTETVSIDHVKDITVVNGTPGFDREKCSSPHEWTSLEDLQSEDAELENIILLETLEAGDSNDGDYGSRVNHINHNIRVTSLTSELGVSSNGQNSPYSSSCSQR